MDDISQQLRTRRILAWLRIAIGIILIVLSITVMVGWFLQSSLLTQILPAFVPMQFNTALGFLLTGLGLLFAQHLRVVAALLGGLLVVLSALTLLQYIFGINFGIDQLFVRHAITTLTSHPGRMAPNTATCFLLIGCGFVLLYKNTAVRYNIMFALAIAVFCLGLLSLFGYIFDVSNLYIWGSLTGMALHTAAGFFLAGVALMTFFIISQKGKAYWHSPMIPLGVGVFGIVSFILLLQITSYLQHEQIKKEFRIKVESIGSELSRELAWRIRLFNRFFAQFDESDYGLVLKLQQAGQNYIKEIPNIVSIATLNLGAKQQADRFNLVVYNSKQADLALATQLVATCLDQYAGNFSHYKTNDYTIHIPSMNNYYMCQVGQQAKNIMVVNITNILTNILQPKLDPDMVAYVTDHGRLIYNFNLQRIKKVFVLTWQQNYQVHYRDIAWTLVMAPTEKYIQKNVSWLLYFIPLMGFIIIVLLALVLRFLQIISIKNAKLAVKVKQETMKLLETEERLSKSESLFGENKKLYELILDNITDGWWDWRLEQGQEYFSPKLKKVLGYESNEIGDEPKALQNLMVPEDKTKAYELFRQHVNSRGHTPYQVELRFYHKDGHIVWIYCRGQGIPDTDGVIRRVVGSHTDISRMKEIEHKLAEKLKELDLIQEVTNTMLAADELTETIAAILGVICKYLNWPVGHIYLVDEESTKLVPAEVWYIGEGQREDIKEFYDITMKTPFSKGVGLPGRVWQSQQPAVITDIQTDDNFPRAKLCKHLKLHNALALPVIVDNKVVGVLEFFSYGNNLIDVKLEKIFSILTEQVGLILEKKTAAKQLEKFARYDVVTNIPNRIYFQEMLKRMLAKAQRQGYKFALMFLDLDNFKVINDTMGHLFGDKLLYQVAERIKSVSRDIDFLARLGGDEFVILLDAVSEIASISQAAQRFLNIFDDPFIIDDQAINISVSIGIAMYPNAGKDATTLLKSADVAMYKAKDSGRGNYQFYTQELNEQFARTLLISQELKKAIKNDELYLVYQPQIDFRAGKIDAIEALIRWENDKLGMVSPVEFIPVAESSGLINEIGEIVFEKACHQIHAWRKTYPDMEIIINVNCSIFQLKKVNFVKYTRDYLDALGLDGSHIVIEITESRLMEHIDITKDILVKLNSFGVKVAIDDFGTGYSSLSYLRDLPISILKIDKSFVDDIGKDRSDEKIIDAIIRLAHALDLEVIAEGVETRKQLDFLIGKDCYLAQGYYFAKPMPADSVLSYIKDFDLARYLN